MLSLSKISELPRAKRVEIRTTAMGYPGLGNVTYDIAVLVDGVLSRGFRCRPWEVVKLRNRECEAWSERADEVIAGPIPSEDSLKEDKGCSR